LHNSKNAEESYASSGRLTVTLWESQSDSQKTKLEEKEMEWRKTMKSRWRKGGSVDGQRRAVMDLHAPNKGVPVLWLIDIEAFSVSFSL